MRKTITIIFAVMLTLSFVSAIKTIDINLIFSKDGEASLDYAKIGCSYLTEDVKAKDAFSIKLLSENEEILDSINFEPFFYILSNPPTETDFSFAKISFPYTEEAKYLKIEYNKEDKLFTRLENLTQQEGCEVIQANQIKNRLFIIKTIRMFKEGSIGIKNAIYRIQSLV